MRILRKYGQALAYDKKRDSRIMWVSFLFKGYYYFSRQVEALPVCWRSACCKLRQLRIPISFNSKAV